MTSERSMVEDAESTTTGAIEMAAARAGVEALDLLHRAIETTTDAMGVAAALGIPERDVWARMEDPHDLDLGDLARLLRAAGARLVISAEPIEREGSNDE